MTHRDPSPRLAGKVAVVTGGASGIGLGIAREFVAHGARVAIVGRRAEALEAAARDLDDGVLAVPGDVARIEDLDRVFAATAARLGPIDVLVANAGVARMLPVEAFDEAAFDGIADINFKGTYFTVQRALPHLADGASIVLVSSIGNRKGMPGLSVYNATKAAVRSLARSFSAELLPRGIRVNALSPGPIETPMFDKVGLPEEAKEAFVRSVVDGNPMHRWGRAEEMARAALFLASPDSSFVAGAELVADGGLSQL